MSNFEVIMGVVLVTIVASAIVLYNNLINLRNECDRAFGNIDVLLRQRTDELPNLVQVCRAHMTHERETLREVSEARAAAHAAHTPAEADLASGLAARAMGSLFALAESYPDLKANRSFLLLQKRITGIENEIADRREFFNQTVTAWNTRIEQFPDALIAGPFLKGRRRPLLRLAGIEPVRVNLAA
ncbi:MAG: LemA family protein [Candidatus Eisenbacteria bacterium]|nr:LemA family protein [Candidatus Eisenbacteria bacterium]